MQLLASWYWGISARAIKSEGESTKSQPLARLLNYAYGMCVSNDLTHVEFRIFPTPQEFINIKLSLRYYALLRKDNDLPLKKTSGLQYQER